MGDHKIAQLIKDMAVKSGLTATTGTLRKLPTIRLQKRVYKS